jgi:hypothetical protein
MTAEQIRKPFPNSKGLGLPLKVVKSLLESNGSMALSREVLIPSLWRRLLVGCVFVCVCVCVCVCVWYLNSGLCIYKQVLYHLSYSYSPFFFSFFKVFIYFLWYLSLNSGPHTCWAGALLSEPLCQPHFSLVIFHVGSYALFTRADL